jgi:L-ascorbate metabolism protein UlaG (beta-lactamase superfamily)
MNLIYYGHSCFSVRVRGKTLLFDPFISPNPLAQHINLAEVPADYILISHGHEDHTADALVLAKRTGATIVSNFEICQWFGSHGAAKTHAMNHGGSRRFEFGRVKYVAAIHSSSMPDGTYGGNPGGWVVESDEGSFYYSGDTALTTEMKLIGETTQLKFAVLCMGDNFTMGVDDAIRAADFVRCNEVVGVHYDTFPPIKIDQQAAIEKFKAAHKRLHLMRAGEGHNF